MRSIFMLPLIVTLLVAQDKPLETKQEAFFKSELQAEIIPVKTLTGDSFDRLLKLLKVFDARVQGDSQLRTIVVYAPKDVVVQMRRMVEQLDRLGSEAAIGRNIDMTLTLLRCSTSMGSNVNKGQLPADMESVARQLRAATQYKDIQLWDVVPVRVQEGKNSTENLRLPGIGAGGQFATASFTIKPESVYRKDQGRYVRFDRLSVDFRIPISTGSPNNTQFSYQDFGINTSGDFMEGQKTVLGKVSGIEDGDAIFVVITLKVLD